MPSFPETSEAYILAHRNDLSGLTLKKDWPTPKITSPSQILIRIRAVSLNARDNQVVQGKYPAPHSIPDNVVPCSDGAGEVVAVGDAVEDFKIGDTAAPTFTHGHYYEEDLPLSDKNRGLWTGMGGAIDGTARQYLVCEAADAVKVPKYLSFTEASTLSNAPPTAWTSLFGHHRKLQAGQTVLCLGTGGVSLGGAQLALVSGAKIILTSSSDAKLAKCVALLKPAMHPSAPADTIQTINYGKTPEWDVEARRLTGGMGVDFVIEIGGQGTLAKSIRSTKPNGFVAISGYMSDYGHIPQAVKEEDIAKVIMYSQVNVRGTFGANKFQYEEMLKMLEMAQLKPIMDEKIFAWTQMAEAYTYLEEGKHIGKVVVTVD